MASSPTSETDTEHLAVADFDASIGENPDPTGDFASGRTRVLLDTDEFLAYLDHCHQTATEGIAPQGRGPLLRHQEPSESRNLSNADSRFEKRACDLDK